MPLQHIVDLHRYVLENAHKIVTIAKGCKVVMYLNVPINHWPFIPWDVRLIAIGIYRHHTVNLFADTTIAPPIQGTASEPDPLVVVVAPLAQEIFLDLPVCLSVCPTTDPSIPQHHMGNSDGQDPENEVCNSGVRANNESDKKPYYVNQKTVVAFRLFFSLLTTRPHQEQESIE